jgi:UDP-N-acetyl-D-galactosamine dehydrogenase
MDIFNNKIGIVGLGYVGLPLAVAFAEKFKVIGFDINKERNSQLNLGYDSTQEVDQRTLVSVLDFDNNLNQGLHITNDKKQLRSCNVYIITVPTPIDKFNSPDLRPMKKATETVAGVLKRGDIVIYESTVYPGVTEDEMVPILEKQSGLKFNEDFFCGYSPERINPGDKEHTVKKILKITSGSTPAVADRIDSLYRAVIEAGTFKASSIKVAEAAKVIENSQRDINIAFVNELSKIFNLLGIDTNEVLEAAGTKWNFLKFKPGLVGGHCIGVDPYYLAQKAQELGYHPEVILSGRRVNDSMGIYIANEVIRIMLKNNINVIDSNLLLLGFTFKENCPDFRNTKVIDIVKELNSVRINVTIFDPWVNSEQVKKEFDIQVYSSESEITTKKYDAIVLAVSHREFLKMDLESLIVKGGIVYDVKGCLPDNFVTSKL